MPTRAEVLALPASMPEREAARLLNCHRGVVSGHRYRARLGIPSRAQSPRIAPPALIIAARNQPAPRTRTLLMLMSDGRPRTCCDIRAAFPSAYKRTALAQLLRVAVDKGLLTRIAPGIYQDQSE